MSKLASEVSDLRLSLDGKNRQIAQQAVLIKDLEELIEMMKGNIERKDHKIEKLESEGKRWPNTIKEVESMTRETELMKRLVAEKDKNEILEKRIVEISKNNSKLKIERDLLHDEIDRITRRANVNRLGRSSSDRISSKCSTLKDQDHLPSYKSTIRLPVSKNPSGPSLAPLSARYIAQVPVSEGFPVRPPNPSPPSYLSISPDPLPSLQAELPPFSALNPRKFPNYDTFLKKVNDLDSRDLKRARKNPVDPVNQRETGVAKTGRLNGERNIPRKAVKFEENEVKDRGSSISKRHGISNFDEMGF